MEQSPHIPTNGERTLLALEVMRLVVQRGVDTGDSGIALAAYCDSLKEDEILGVMANLLALRKGVGIFYRSVQETCLINYPHKFLEIFYAEPDQPEVPSRQETGPEESSRPT